MWSRTIAYVLVCGVCGIASGPAWSQQADADRVSAPSAVSMRIERADHGSRLVLDDGRTIRVTEAAVRDAHLIAVPDSATLLATWQENDSDAWRPYYSVALDGGPFVTPRATSYDLKLRHGEFEPLLRDSAVSPQLRADAETNVYVVQFVVQPLEELVAGVERLGAKVHQYLPRHAYIMSMTPDVTQAVEALPYVRWVGSYHPAYRLEAPLAAALRGEAPQPQAARYRVQMLENGPDVKNAVADRIVALGGSIDHFRPGGMVLEATLTQEQLLAVARMNEVQFIERWSAPRSSMNNVRVMGGANYIQSVAGYTGAGVRGEVMDDGCQTGHPDFAGRIAIRGNTNFSPESHGTATFGIVFGSGGGASTAKGMMPGAFGYFNDWVMQTSRYSDIWQLGQAPYNCVFQTNSWGYAPTTDYTSATSELDRAIFDWDIVIINSQGNEGTQFGSEQAWGKNVVGVGGVVHWDDAFLGNDTWSHTASIGPATDGRIKPDLCFYYDAIRTTAPGGYTSDFGGTSAAAPETAGHFGLFYQMWNDGIFGNPVNPGGSVFSNRPHSSTARAMMYNTASAYGFIGATHDLTRTHQGWGLPNVQNLYDRRDNILVVNETVVITQFQTKSYARAITTGVPNHDELRVTLVWTDPEGTTSASQHRINDLTLKVTSPSGVIYWGNNGLLEGNWSTSGGSANSIDTVENVFVRFPEQGSWTIDVRADDINRDGHVETGPWDADYALVISGGDSCFYADVVVQPEDTYTCYGDVGTLEAVVTDYTSLQWYKDDVALDGETGLTLSIPDFSPADDGEYILGATNACGERFTEPATLMDAGWPTIVQQPTAPSSPRCEGEELFLEVVAGGIGPFTYQWYHEGELVPGETDYRLWLQPAQAEDAGAYYCAVSNMCHSIDTNTVIVQIAPAPHFTQHPQDSCGEIGETIVLTVSATSEAPFVYQWRKDGAVVGSGGDTLTLADLQPSDAGDYWVLAFTTTPLCIAYSDTATVRVGDCGSCLTPGDIDGDGDHDMVDIQQFIMCFGKTVSAAPECACANVDDGDDSINLADWIMLEPMVDGPQ